MKKLLIFISVKFLATSLLISCNSHDQSNSQAGSLQMSEIEDKYESGDFIGLTKAEFTALCGASDLTDKYINYDYKKVIGRGESYFPAHKWLLASYKNNIVCDVKIDCD